MFSPRPRGFLGADGASTLRLPDGRILWLFADTVVGTLKDGRRNGPMIHNSIAIQDTPDSPPQFWWRIPERVPHDAFPPQSDKAKHWYWPGCGIESGGRIYVFMMKVATRPGVEGVFGFRVIGCTLLRIDNPTEPPDNWRISQVDLVESELFNINSAALVEGEYVYLLGHQDRATSGPDHRAAILCRMPLRALDSSDPGRALEFWSDDDTWRATPEHARRLFSPAPTESSLQFDPVRRRYIAAVVIPFTSELGIVSAEKLTGPWSKPQLLYTIDQVTTGGKGLFAYAGRAHPELARSGDELVLTYVVNADDFWDMFANPAIYFPRFVRVQLGKLR